MTEVTRQSALEVDKWTLWRRQVVAILRMEVSKNFWGRRALLLYLLAVIPVVILFLLAIVDPDASGDIARDWNSSQQAFANIYDALVLRSVVFFGCAWIFMNLFRGEVVDRSLHYYLLAALRREVLVVAKYISGVAAAGTLFTLSTLGALFFLYYARGYPANLEFLLDGPGWSQVLAYEAITLLACLGYGAVFMFIGLFFRNPIIPALVVYGWEWINFLLPPLLKKISIIHYLESHLPIPIDEGPFATIVAPTSAWISVPSLLVFTGVVLLLTALRIRRMEIRYGME
jgi:ABC-type transport system involved in multi-copper enzyme maturation permease subunit